MAQSISAPASTAVPAAQELTPVSLKAFAPWALFGGVLMLSLIYFLGVEQGSQTHEWLHDGRHLLGFPCH